MSNEVVLSSTTMADGLDVVNNPENLEIINLRTLKTKELGLQVVLMGLAERNARRICHLDSFMEELEESLFDMEQVEHLSSSEKIERYQLAMQASTASAAYIKGAVSNIDWSSMEIQMLSLIGAAEDLTGGTNAAISKDALKEVAGQLLNEYHSRLKPS